MISTQDAICKSRGSVRDGTGVSDSIVNQLLSKIDGVDSHLNDVLLRALHPLPASRFRDVDDFAIDTLYFSTFFGGGSSSWATTADEVVWFDDFEIRALPR